MESTQAPDPAPTIRKKVTKRTKLILWLMLGPTVLFAVSFILFGISNLAFGTLPQTLPEACVENGTSIATSPTAECQEQLLGDQSPPQMVINTILSLVILTSIITWIPGLVAGAILLIKRREASPTSTE
jgi:hypothetical protein